MYIVSAAATIDPLAPLWPSLALALGAAAAVALGLWRRTSIVGPSRLDHDEPSEPLSIAAGCGLAVYFLFSIFATLTLSSAHPGPTTAGGDIKLTDAQSVMVDLAARIAAISSMLMVLGFLYHRVWRLGLGAKKIPLAIAQALVGAMVVLPLMWMALVITEKILHPEGQLVHPYLKLIGETKDDIRLKAALFISVIAAAPVSEEIFFRGCLQTMLVSALGKAPAEKPGPLPLQEFRIPVLKEVFLFINLGRQLIYAIRLTGSRHPAAMRWLAVILTSLLFAMVHDWWSRPPIFVLAICLGYAYERTGNLWTAILLHAMFNGVEVAMFLHSGG